MAKTPPLGVRLAPEVREALERVAAADSRSLSSMVERILRAWLVEQGHLKDAAANRP